jgi:hypothetical protein
MREIWKLIRRRTAEAAVSVALLLSVGAMLAPGEAQAVPAFARQTGQNCVACHAGGQFPELTPYGRIFKMTGYTIGERAMPLAVMGTIGYSRVANTGKDPDPQQTFAKNGMPLFSNASLFIAGKATDNIGAFVQVTYDNYAAQALGSSGNNDGRWTGHSQADNMDIRYADRFIDGDRDLIVGLSLNNNPSVTDAWNTAPAWMQYVPTPSPGSSMFADAATPYPGNSTGGNVAGLNAYAFWNKTVYGEIGLYGTAHRALSFMSSGIKDVATTHLRGTNPYWRLAVSHEWGPHNIMVGTMGAIAHVFDGTTDVADANAYNKIKTLGLDTQYQYLLDPHSVTVQAIYQRQRTDYSANTVANNLASWPVFFLADGVTPVAMPNPSDTLNIFRAKLSYVYQAKYGGSLSLFDQHGTTNTANQTVGFDDTGTITGTQTTGNLAGNLGMRGATFELFWMPVQYVRVGAQYTAYSRFNGASSNYEGFGRDAKDNNTLFGYVWFAY